MFTQFQGAFSDNALRWLVIFPVLASVALSDDDKENFASQATTLFAVPFLLFSTIGGWLADRFSKRSVMVGVKIGEIAIMLFATLALAWASKPLQLAAICLMGIHSTFFAPAKYGIMPEVLPVGRLSAGTGSLELLTFVGIAARADDAAGSLPYGDQRRLEIARALATDPKLIALDEPAAGMNATESRALARLVRNVRELGITVLLIEHDMKLVMSLCDRLLVLDHGERIIEGAPVEVQSDARVIDAYLGVARPESGLAVDDTPRGEAPAQGARP